MRALDGLRGAAILAVVAFHTAVMATREAAWAGSETPPFALWPVFASKLGVDLFFVLSGFLVLRSWQQIRGSHDHHDAVAEFAHRRARRILPAYWATLVVFVPLRVPEWLTTFDGLADIGAFVSLQQFLDTDLPHHVNVVTWSLTTEVHFYVLLPALAYAFARFGWRKVLPLLVIGAIGWRVMQNGTGLQAEWIWGRIDQFAAGMAAATIVTERKAHRRIVDALRKPWVGAALFAVFAVFAVPLGALQLLGKPLAYEATFHSVIGLVLAAWIVRGVTNGFPSVFDNRALRGLGDASYSLYLWHWPLLMEATRRWGASAGVIAAALGVTAVCTALSYLAFERPFINARRARSSVPSASRGDQRVAANR